MESGDTVLYEVTEQVAWITLNRPDKLNAVNAAMGQRLFEVFRHFDDDDSAKVAILIGAGRAFCAGGDLKEMANEAMEVPPTDMAPNLEVNLSVDKPVIAAVNGIALAGGFRLAQMCDLCVAAVEVSFAITEVKRGRGAPWGAPLIWMLPQRVMMELLLTGEPLSAQRAYELGFINKVVPLSELRATAMELALKIAGNAPLSVMAGKRMTYTATDLGRLDAVKASDAIYETAYLSDDAQEGPRAFRDGRSPQWTGH